MFQIPGYLGALFPVPLRISEPVLLHISGIEHQPFRSEITKKSQKTAFLHNFQSVNTALHLSLSLFLGYILYIDIPPYVFTNSVGLWEISF